MSEIKEYEGTLYRELPDGRWLWFLTQLVNYRLSIGNANDFTGFTDPGY